jgi:hypothetical protein
MWTTPFSVFNIASYMPVVVGVVEEVVGGVMVVGVIA